MNLTHHLAKVSSAPSAAPSTKRGEVSTSSEIKRLTQQLLKTLPKDALLMFPDLDDFLTPQRHGAHAEGDGAVLGHMVTASPTTGPPKATTKPLWLQPS